MNIGSFTKIRETVDAFANPPSFFVFLSKPFFNDLVSFITSGPIVAIAFQGPNCVKKIRNINGSTDPTEASPGTIRGDFGISLSMNLIHSSDSIESAQRELKIFFEKSELVDYNKNIDEWILE